ncbi:MAG: hypothetical protein ACQEVA_15675 [Myxococcota bacterium]
MKQLITIGIFAALWLAGPAFGQELTDEEARAASSKARAPDSSATRSVRDVSTSPARFQRAERAEDAPDTQREIKGGLLPGMASLVPGVLLHGSGTFVAGDRETGLKLLKWQGISTLALAASFTELVLTGASRKTIWLSAPTVLLSFGTFTQTWLADIYGAFSGAHSTGSAALALPKLRLDVGYRYVFDPQFDYRNFTYLAAEFWVDRVRVSSQNWLALDDANVRTGLLGDWRIIGPTHDEYASNGSTLDLRMGARFARFGGEGFSVLTPEVQMRGRLDLGEVGRSLEGAFADASVGLGFEVYDYDAAGLPFGSDVNSLLLGGFGFGLYHDVGNPGGEVRLYYDHRHDTYAGGAHLSDLGGGVPGYFGIETHFDFGHWGIGADLKAGSAYIGGLNVRYNGWMPMAPMPTVSESEGSP